MGEGAATASFLPQSPQRTQRHPDVQGVTGTNEHTDFEFFKKKKIEILSREDLRPGLEILGGLCGLCGKNL